MWIFGWSFSKWGVVRDAGVYKESGVVAQDLGGSWGVEVGGCEDT